MGDNLKGNHLKLIKNIYKSMKDFIVQFDTKSGFEIGKGSFSGDRVRKSTIPAIGPSSIHIPQDFKKFIHILMPVNVAKQLKQKKRWRIIGRRTFNGVARCSQRPDKRKINQRSDHFCIPALDITIGQNVDMLFFESVI